MFDMKCHCLSFLMCIVCHFFAVDACHLSHKGTSTRTKVSLLLSTGVVLRYDPTYIGRLFHCHKDRMNGMLASSFKPFALYPQLLVQLNNQLGGAKMQLILSGGFWADQRKA